MTSRRPVPRKPAPRRPDAARLDVVVAQARQAREERARGYREQSLRIHGTVCARCGRDFSGKSLHLLTVHHRDGNHDHNPPDGSNWENLCVYCHEDEHSRELEHLARSDAPAGPAAPVPATHSPFAGLKDLLSRKKG